MPSFKDEHILIIVPGSQTTLAQLGLPESFTPARLRVPTRMFPAEKVGEWEPYKIRERVRSGGSRRGSETQRNADAVMNDGGTGANGHVDGAAAEDEITYEEDTISDEGAVYPIVDGRVVNWPCFYALLSHIYNILSPPFHTPMIIVTQPAWTLQDKENVTHFCFEKIKPPALSLMDAAIAAIFAYSTPHATVVDVGHTKCDVTVVRDFTVSDVGRAIALPNCGGEAMTRRLLRLLEHKGFNRDMCEQLKQNSICEVLPPGAALPVETEDSDPAPSHPVDTAAAGDSLKGENANQGITSRGGGAAGQNGDAEQDEGAQAEEQDGVLDVASIVASGKAGEILAQREKEKAAKAAARKAAVAEAAAAQKQAKLPNSMRPKAAFYYHERRPIEELTANASTGATGESHKQEPKSQISAEGQPTNGADDTEIAIAQARKDERREERRRSREGTAYIRKEVEVGIERFEAASDGLLDRIADAVHRCISSGCEVSKRGELWESIIITGNGSKVKGFKEALLAILHAKYLISPSSATIFTSELPSNFTTPVATGANTPQPQSHHTQVHHGAGVNPLLLAATTASNTNLAPPSHVQQQQQQLSASQAPQQYPHLYSHSQAPTSIKHLKTPEYFPEWKEYGMEEAIFLGAQIAAKVIFVVDNGATKGYMNRVEYNDLGPSGIHEICP